MEKIKIFIFMFVFFFFVIIEGAFSCKINLKELKTIGSDSPHYEFFLISGVDTDDKGNIYIADGRGCFIRKYSKDGKFIAKTGKRGQGPGDFGDLIDIVVGKDKIFVKDNMNKRIAIYPLDLRGTPQYIKTSKIGYFTSFFYMNGLLYLTKQLSLDPEKADFEKRIVGVKINSSGIKIIYSFFDKFPDFYKKGKKGKMEMALFMTNMFLKSAGDEKRNEVVSTFVFPEKALSLYYYSGDGKFLRKHSIEILKGYKMPRFYLKFPFKYPPKHRIVTVGFLDYFRSRYIVVHYSISFYKRKKKIKSESFLMFVDANTGKIVAKLRVEEGIRIFKIKGDYLYAKNFDDDIEKLHVYKIEGIK